MKNTFIIIIALFLQFQVTGQELVLEKVIAKVGSEFILLSELEEQFAYVSQQNPGLPPEARCALLENLMVNKLLVNQSKLDSVEISEAQLAQQLEARMSQILQQMGNDETMFKQVYGMGMQEAKLRMKEDMKAQMLAESMQTQITSEISITPSEVVAFYDAIPVDSLPNFNAEVEVSEIVYIPRPNEEQKTLAKAKLIDIKKRIDEGESFEELAIIYSDDLGSGRAGGDLGWASRGSYVAEFEAAAFSLETNEFSPITETQYGYHLLQLLERRGNSVHIRHILIKPEIVQSDLDKAVAYLDSVRTAIITDSLDFNKTVKEFSDKESQSFNNAGRITNSLTGNTFFEMSELDFDVFFAIDTIDVGEITSPIKFKDPRGEVVYKIIQLSSKTLPHTANLEQDYSKIQTAAKESKKNVYLNEWIEEKIGSTFISIDDNFDTCPTVSNWETNE